MNWVQYILVLAVRLYQWGISPAKTLFFGPAGQCRFTPSCSQYAAEAVQTHGAMRGSLLAAKRICRCHPWGGCGDDPVPVKKFKVQGSKFKVFGSGNSWAKATTVCEPINVYAHPPHEPPAENPPLPGPLLPPQAEREKNCFGLFPRVARVRAGLAISQPWANSRNPFGVRDGETVFQAAPVRLRERAGNLSHGS